MLQQQLAIEIELRQRELWEEAQHKYSNSLVNFIRDAWPIVEPVAPFVHGWHIDAIAEHLMAVTRGEIKRLLINVPPGMMKSLATSVFWPVWEWGPQQKTHYRYICVSHSESLAIRDNIKMRRMITDPWFQNRFPYVNILSDQNAKIKFENSMLGFREARTAGSITGSRGDRVIIDDPHSVDSANSDAMRESTIQWFEEAVPTRLNSPKESAIVVIMQRLHDKDVSGVILQRELGYTHLMLPMEYEKERKCRTYWYTDPRKEEGELLFPERFPREVIERDKKILGQYAVAGQFQQNPIPRGGAILKSEWMHIVEEIPEQFSMLIQSWDTSFKMSKGADFNVGVTIGMYEEDFYIIDLVKVKAEIPELTLTIESTLKRYKPNYILIEDQASGQSVIQILKRTFGAHIKAIKPDKNKVARCMAVSPLFENGCVKILKSPWTAKYIANLTRFPRGTHDDDVDATTMGLTHLWGANSCTQLISNVDIFAR